MNLMDGFGLGQFLLHLLVNAVAVTAGAYLLKGVYLRDFSRALIVAIVLAVLNATLGAVLDFLTFPLRFLTLGLFSLVVDAIVIMVTDYFLKGFAVKNFWWAVALAVVIALVNTVLGWIL